MDKETYKKTYGDIDDAAPGWDAIDAQLATIYANREPDGHWGTLIRHMLGGPDPIDGISAYIVREPDPHIHYVSYGMSELYYNEDATEWDASKWGFEFTFRLALSPGNIPAKEADIPMWPIGLMQNLARYVFEYEKWFEHLHFMKTNGPIEAESDTLMKGLLFALDPQLGDMSTPHGKVEFIQMVGTTEPEVMGLYDKAYTTTALYDVLKKTSPLLLTDMNRRKNLIGD